MAKRGRNRLLAHDLFSDYLTHPLVMASLSKSVGCPVALLANTHSDMDLAECQRVCEHATPMPSFPGMRHVWEVVGRAQAAAIRGADAEGTARRAAKEVAYALRIAGALNE